MNVLIVIMTSLVTLLLWLQLLNSKEVPSVANLTMANISMGSLLEVII